MRSTLELSNGLADLYAVKLELRLKSSESSHCES